MNKSLWRANRICVGALVLICALPGWSKGKSAEAKSASADLDSDSSIEITAKIGFADVDEDAATYDWGALSGGPVLKLAASTRTSWSPNGLAWLEIGPELMADAKVESETIESSSSSSGVYLAAESANLRALLGFGAEVAFPVGSAKAKVGLLPLGGLGIFDLDDADPDYLTTGASAEDFWFRVEPCAGFSATGKVKLSAFELSVENRYLATWDSGDAYGRDWTLGFEEAAAISASYKLLDRGGLEIKAKALMDYSLESKLIVPTEEFSTGLRFDIDRKGLGRIKITPIAWSSDSELPNLDFSSREDVERQLSGKLEWEAPTKSGSWSVFLSFPYWADEDGTSSAGAWSMGLSLKLE
jgi:hypothetical protein